jgi:hypothetical protein
VIHIVAGVDLRLAVGILVVFGIATWIILVPRLPLVQRERLRRRAAAGAVAGLVGALSYDAARYGVVALLSLSFEPFHVFEVFGHLFLGPQAGARWAFALGALYHLANGTCFGVAYTIAVRRPRPLTGMAWGLALEFCMATLYPTWLRIQQMGEFLEVSALGHLVYGAVLGLVAGRLLSKISTGTAAATSQANDRLTIKGN